MAQNDYQKMASAFLDMWQQQLTRTMNDRDMVKSMMQTVQQMQQNSSSAFKESYEPRHRHTAPASGAYDDELVELSERLADCEQRIAALEAELKSYQKPTRSSKPAPKTTPASKSKAKPAAAKSKNSSPKRQPSTTKPAKARVVARATARQKDTHLVDKATDDALASLKKAVIGTANRSKSGKPTKR